MNVWLVAIRSHVTQRSVDVSIQHHKTTTRTDPSAEYTFGFCLIGLFSRDFSRLGRDCWSMWFFRGGCPSWHIANSVKALKRSRILYSQPDLPGGSNDGNMSMAWCECQMPRCPYCKMEACSSALPWGREAGQLGVLHYFLRRTHIASIRQIPSSQRRRVCKELVRSSHVTVKPLRPWNVPAEHCRSLHGHAAQQRRCPPPHANTVIRTVIVFRAVRRYRLAASFASARLILARLPLSCDNLPPWCRRPARRSCFCTRSRRPPDQRRRRRVGSWSKAARRRRRRRRRRE